MGSRVFWIAGILGVIGAAAGAQPMEQRANITGGGNPGGNGRGRSDLYRFSCSVDFGSGRVRSADFERMDRR